jgi:hypothetical protein
MSTQLIYDGILSNNEADTIRTFGNQGFKYWLEFKEFPDGIWTWMRNNLKQYPSMGEDCMGGEYQKMSVKYVRARDFLGLYTAGEKSMIIDEFGSSVFNKTPFKTVLL